VISVDNRLSLPEWKLSRLSRRAENDDEYRFLSLSKDGLGGASSSVYGIKLSFKEDGRPTADALLVDPGLGLAGRSLDGLDDKLGALKGCINVTLGRRGREPVSLNRDRDV
jgi:hypothetical protein